MFASALRRKYASGLLALLAIAPAFFVFWRTADARKNIVYWDEIDTALAMVLRLEAEPTPAKFVREMFAINNEHRMVTSRLLYATMYGITDTLNFVFISVVGNATIIGLWLLLIFTAGTSSRRATMAVVFAALFFQLEHYECFMWSGSSIDHFQIVLLAAGAVVALARNTRASTVVGAILAALATFTLAHGMLVWPIGAGMLWHQRNRAGLILWGIFALVVIGGFLLGFQLNRAQEFAGWSFTGAITILLYWLTLLGAVPAMGGNVLAPWLGVMLLALIAWLVRHESVRRERIALPMILFAIGALALIAIGRAQLSGGLVFSRYYIHGAVAWGMVIFILLGRFTPPQHPWRPIAWALPALVIFNVSASRLFSADAESWLEFRDRAVVEYVRHGVDGRGPLTLHPAPSHATTLLQEAEKKNVYRMAAVCVPRPFPRNAKPSTRIAYFVDEMTISGRSAYIGGWAAIQGERSERGRVHLMFRSNDATFVLTTVTETRPDVAKATNQPDWVRSGFRFASWRDQLPVGEFQIGFLIETDKGPEFVMTAHKLDLRGEGKAWLATGD